MGSAVTLARVEAQLEKLSRVMPSFTPEQHLKLRLLANGLRVAEPARRAWAERFAGPLTLAEYATTSGVSIALEGAIYVNAPLTNDDAAPALAFDGDGFCVVADGRETAAEVVPVPAFHNHEQVDRLDGTVQPYTRFGITHTDRVRVSPIEGCAWKCHFCDLPYEYGYRRKHEEDLLEVIKAAERDELAPARHVLISGGTPRAPMPARPGRPARDDEAWIDGVFAHLATHSPLPVSVMMPPRRELGHPEWLRSVGVESVSINLEVSDEGHARRIAPAKAKVGRKHTLDYIERAVEAFGIGAVQSLVVLGSAIEPLESTLRGVQDLVDRGCIPVLSPFRPHHLTPLASAPAATYDEMAAAYHRTVDICARAGNGVLPGPRCVPCHHNTVTFPDDRPFYVGVEDDLSEHRCLTC